MGAVLLILSVVLAIAGVVISGLTGVTLGLAGCVCAILAAIDQGDRRHQAEIAMLERIEHAAMTGTVTAPTQNVRPTDHGCAPPKKYSCTTLITKDCMLSRKALAAPGFARAAPAAPRNADANPLPAGSPTLEPQSKSARLCANAVADSVPAAANGAPKASATRSESGPSPASISLLWNIEARFCCPSVSSICC